MSTPTINRPATYPTSPPPRRPPPTAPARRPLSIAAIPMPVLAGLATLCTTLCLGNLFDGLRWWLLPSAGAIVLAGVTGEVGRRIRTPRAAMPFLYLVAGWLYVIPVATRGADVSSSISLWPSGTTWTGLRDLAQSGSQDIRSLTVPVPERPGFLFLTVAGVYLIAALVDGIAAGLNRPAASGLPLLALLAVPAAVVERGVGLIAFLAACAAYVAMLLASGRRSMTAWARLPPGAAPGIRRMTGATGRRIGIIAIIAALAIPVVIPRYSGLARHSGGGGGGSGSATVIEPVVTLAQQVHNPTVEPLLTVRTTAPEYLRLTALEHFDGKTFTLGSLSAKSDARVSRGLPSPAAGSKQRIQASISVMPQLQQRYLPVPYQPTKVNVDGDWRLADQNFTIFSAQTTTSSLQYTVTSEVSTPTPKELESQSASASSLPSAVVPSIELPSTIDPDVSSLAFNLTAPYSTEYEKAAAIQAYLRGSDFTYDLTGAPSGPDALADFLLRDKRGYCEQFAGAMVVLARVAGIPARVAVGFTPGTQRPDGSWLVTNHDAHSWPEIWFPQAGWVRFEPTKRDETTPPSYTIPPASSRTDPTPTPSTSAGTSAAPSAAPTGPTAGKSEQPTVNAIGGSRGSSSADVLAWTLGIVAALSLLLVPAFVRRRRRRARLLGRMRETDGGARWREVVDTATDLGLEVPLTLTPRRAVIEWSRLPNGERRMPDATFTVLMEVAYAQELALYAGRPSESADGGSRLLTALQDWERSAGALQRARAVLAPRSLLRATADWGLRPLDRFRRPASINQV